MLVSVMIITCHSSYVRRGVNEKLSLSDISGPGLVTWSILPRVTRLISLMNSWQLFERKAVDIGSNACMSYKCNFWDMVPHFWVGLNQFVKTIFRLSPNN